ncbi:MAG: efflux RND transporter permease subunit, partial [Chitinivibrionales bacterium]|nr:efflux RND transporter permease subunit [Chitinivibrionales bacterium]
FNPVFASLTMTTKDIHSMEGGKDWFDHFKDFYRRLLKTVLHHPWILAILCLSFVITGIWAYGKFGSGVVFFPIVEPDVASIQIEGPLGQDIAITDATLQIPERIAMAMPADISSVATVSAVVGSGKSSRMSGSQSESNKGYLDLVFADYEKRKVSPYKTMSWLEDTLPSLVPGWKLQVIKQAMGPPTGMPIELEVGGDNYQELSRLADSLKAIIRQVPGLTNVTDDYDPARPEIRVNVDREQAKRLGFSTVDVASAVRGAIYGTEAGKYRVGKDEYKIMVRLAPQIRENLNGLNEIVVTKEGKEAPLSSVAVISQGANIASIKHIDGKRAIQVSAELAPGQKDERGPKSLAMAAIKKIVPPNGYTILPGSGNRMQAESQSFLVKAFFIAMGLVFLTMVFQFNSLFQPFLILFGILLSLGGVFWGLLIVNKFSDVVNFITGGAAGLSNVTFAILMSGVGVIALAGVVAKNGIVLIDFMNRLRCCGRTLEDAVIEGGATRLRPVLLTAITAMIGLLPIATGVGIDFLHLGIVTKSSTTQFWAPMAWAIFWGLLFNTLLVLVVTPTFYYAWENYRAKSHAKKTAK